MFYDLNLPYPTQPNLAQQQTELRKRVDLLIKCEFSKFVKFVIKLNLYNN